MFVVFILPFSPFLSVLFVLHRKDLVFLNLISRYMTSTREQLLTLWAIVDLSKVKFCFSKLFIQCNISSWCVYITDGVNIYVYVCQSVGPCMSCMCVCVCDIKPEYHQKPCPPCQTFCKFDALFHKKHSKALQVLRYQGLASVGPWCY